MLITNKDILDVIGCRLKKARLEKNFTEEFVAEQINISADLLRNIENGRNIGSVPTLLNLCNFLEITPDMIFKPLITTKKDTLDTKLTEYISSISKVLIFVPNKPFTLLVETSTYRSSIFKSVVTLL